MPSRCAEPPKRGSATDRRPRKLSAPGAMALPLALLLCSPSSAEEPFEYWPSVAYDGSVPSVQQVLGHPPGERIFSHREIVTYLEALAEARPGQVRVERYARSWEGRDLVYAILGSEETLARLPAIEETVGRLSDPRNVDPGEVPEMLARLPATVFLAYGVHGNEISSPNAALLLAYHLVAAVEDPVVEQILAESLIFIDPLQNPDGRDRFVQTFRANLGIVPAAHPAAAEHDEPWPGGRTNHYLFDLNRDWFAVTQPETAGRIEVLRRWLPLVFVDLHEMGADSTYYFAPEAIPYNPHLARAQRQSLEIFGRNNARWFDRFGFDYFTREVYDAFYPGYGASWPSYYGAVAMTYEMASARGLVMRRSDGSLLHFRDGVKRHFVASVSTLEAASRERRRLWRDFYEYRETALREGKEESPRTYILPRQGDPTSTDKLAGLLVRQGVEVDRAEKDFEACGRTHPAGSYLISLAQPAKRLVRTLLDPHVPMEEAFVAEQERRRAKRLADEIYDVTAWSLPLMFGVEAVPCDSEPAVQSTPASDRLVQPGEIHGQASLAYIVPWGTTGAARLLLAALRRQLTVLSPERAFVIDGRRYPAGSLVFKLTENPPDITLQLTELARQTGAEVYGTDTGWVDEGVNFGSRSSARLRPPAVALSWDRPTSAYSAGNVRFVLERQYGYPVTPLRTRRLSSIDLAPFDVLLLADARPDYGSLLDGERLRDWLEAGGTLVALGAGAVRSLAAEEVGLISTRPEEQVSKPTDEESTDSDKPAGTVLTDEEAYLEAIRPRDGRLDDVAGALLRADLDSDHWLASGIERRLNVLVRGRSVFAPLTLDRGVNVARFAPPAELLASGHLWDEIESQLAFKPFVMVERHGRGQVIAFTADPTVRAYLDGLNLLLVNAIVRGPAHAR